MGIILTLLQLFTGSTFGIRTATGNTAKVRVPADSEIEFRNAADTGYAIGRCAAPVGADDIATRGWVLNSAPSLDGSCRSIGIPVALANASSTATVPTGALVKQVMVEVRAAYSVGATLEVRCGATVLMAAGLINAQLPGVYLIQVPVSPALAGLPVTAVVAGAPVAGSAAVLCDYVVPLA